MGSSWFENMRVGQWSLSDMLQCSTFNDNNYLCYYEYTILIRGYLWTSQVNQAKTIQSQLGLVRAMVNDLCGSGLLCMLWWVSLFTAWSITLLFIIKKMAQHHTTIQIILHHRAAYTSCVMWGIEARHLCWAIVKVKKFVKLTQLWISKSTTESASARIR